MVRDSISNGGDSVGIKPRTLGEFVELLEADRLNEVDPEWLEEVRAASLSVCVLFWLDTQSDSSPDSPEQ